MLTPEDATMLVLLTPTACEDLSGKIQQRARCSTYRASAARYFAGRYLRLQASESAYYACWEDAGMVAFHFTPLLLPMSTSAAERDGDTLACHRPDRQFVVGLGVSCYCWPCMAPVLPLHTVGAPC
jgi:hypothetical protein